MEKGLDWTGCHYRNTLFEPGLQVNIFPGKYFLLADQEDGEKGTDKIHLELAEEFGNIHVELIFQNAEYRGNRVIETCTTGQEQKPRKEGNVTGPSSQKRGPGRSRREVLKVELKF